MADIDVKRGGPSIWPWVLGLLVLAVMIWALAEMFGSEGEQGTPAEPIADTLLIDTVGLAGPTIR